VLMAYGRLNLLNHWGLNLFNLLDDLLGNRRLVLDLLDHRGLLFDVVLMNNWLLLDVLLLLLDVLDFFTDFGLVDVLSLDGLILDSLCHFFLWDIFNIFFLVNLGDILRYVFYGVVIGNFSFFWNVFSCLDGLILYDRFFVGNVLNSRFPFDCFLLDTSTTQ